MSRASHDKTDALSSLKGTPDFRVIFESVPGLHLILSRDLTIVAVSDVYLKATMTRREEIVGRGLFDVFPDNPDDATATGERNLRVSLERVLRDRVPDVMAVQKYDIRRPASEGGGYEERFWSPRNSPILSASGEVDYIIHSVEDVTDVVRLKQQGGIQTRQNEELRRRAESVEATSSQQAKEIQQFQRLFMMSPDMLCIASMEGYFLRVNPAFMETLGYTEEELLTSPYLDFVHPDDRNATLSEAHNLRQGQPTLQFENRYRCKDGSWKWLSWKTQPSLEEGLQYATARDVTEHKRIAAEIVQSRALAESANRAKSQFLANMSHEIRTPMTAIVGYTDLMLDAQQTQSERLDCINIIRRNSDHLLTIINDILDISKIEAGEMQVAPVACSPCQILSDTASLMRVRANDRKLKFEVQAIGPIPQTVNTDPTRLRQIVINLVGNAIKFTETGWVRLVMKLEDAASGPTPLLRFDVIDSGIGIAADDLANLFQPFAQVDSSATRRFAGSGLGLFISRKLARLLGGDIHVDSQVGRGSMFSVTINPGPLAGVKMLPNCSESMVPTEAPPIESTSLEVVGRVLLAEDGIDNQQLLSFYLRRAGADVVVANNGQEACTKALQAMAKGSPFDMIFMDMQMPELDGYAATAKLRSKGYKGVVVALTAHAMAHDREKCLKSGCDDYLAKPVTRAHLIAMAHRYMDRHPQAPDSEAKSQDAVAKLKPVGVDDDAITQFLPSYIARLPEQVSRLQSLLEKNDHAAIADILHQIKGSSGLFGFAPIMKAASRAHEGVARHPSHPSFREKMRVLLELIRSVEGYDPRLEAEAQPKDEAEHRGNK